MEVRVYSQDLKFQGVSENQTSVIWNRKYYDVGNFEIHLPITNNNVKLYQINNIVWLSEHEEAGVIEEIKFTQNHNTNKMVVKGRFLESYMDRRLIHPTFNFSGKTEVAMRNLLDNIRPVIPYVYLGTLQGFNDTIDFQVTWKTLLLMETKLAQSANIGYRFKPDFVNRKIYFNTYKGLDRTRSQHVRSFTEFSEEFNNIDETVLTLNNKLEKNVAYVLGEGEGENRIVEIVGDDTLTGYERKELYVDARDLTSMDLTEAQYRAALRQRGLEKLEENSSRKAFECDTIPYGNFVYKQNYDLGDIVTVKKGTWGLTENLRITEIMEIYEHDIMSIVPTLGNPLPTTLNLED